MNDRTDFSTFRLRRSTRDGTTYIPRCCDSAAIPTPEIVPIISPEEAKNMGLLEASNNIFTKAAISRRPTGVSPWFGALCEWRAIRHE